METKVSENNIIIELKGLTKRYGYGDTESFALKDFDGEINNNFLLHCQKCNEAFRHFKKDDFVKEIEEKLSK